MPPLLGFVTTAGGFVVSLTALIGFLGLCWRGGTRVYQGARWIHAWAVRNEAVSLEVSALAKRVEKVIGNNGGSTLFERMDALEDGQHRIASIADALREPSVLFDAAGEVTTVNVAFRKVTGWSDADLKFGGWRAKLLDGDLESWDDAIDHHGVFERTIRLRGLSRPLIAHIRPIAGARFIGWRGVFEVGT